MNIEAHKRVLSDFTEYLFSDEDTPFVLKGGTSLMLCYGLPRFSEDIDLDAPADRAADDNLNRVIETFCESRGYSFRKAKDTETVKRYFIHYDMQKPLKIEASFRRKEIPEQQVVRINGYRVYDLNQLCMMKCSAYLSRDKPRDLYDITYICTHYFDSLNDAARQTLANAFEYKNLEQFDYLVRTTEDPLIDYDEMESMFLKSFDILGLNLSSEETAQGACIPEGNAGAISEVHRFGAVTF